MMSVREKMLEARELIQKKRYDEARALLVTVNHPKADEWLTRLDKIAPPQANPVPQPKPQTRSVSEDGSLLDRINPDAKRQTSTIPQNRRKTHQGEFPMPVALAIIGTVILIGVVALVGLWLARGGGDIDLSLDGLAERSAELSQYAAFADAQDSGRLTIGQRVENTLSDGNPADVYTFRAEAGQKVVITMASQDFDAVVQLYTADGILLAENDDGGRDFNARIEYTFASTGDYRIVATDFFGGFFVTGGLYALTISPA